MIKCLLHLDDSQIDPELQDKFEKEYSGILNRIVAGARSYMEKGLQIPRAVREWSDRYRQNMDYYSEFITCFVKSGEGLSCTYEEMFNAYKKFCELEGRKPQSKYVLNKELRKRKFRESRTAAARRWIGVRPKTQDDFIAEDQEAPEGFFEEEELPI